MTGLEMIASNGVHQEDIRVITEPTVYLVGRQNVDQAEMDRFLSDHGIAWKSDTEGAGELISEISGRLCYMSFCARVPAATRPTSNTFSRWGTARCSSTRCGISSSRE